MSQNSNVKGTGLFASPYYVLGVLMIGVFMMGLDAYIFTPAVVPLVKDFHTTYDLAMWVSIVYMLFTTAIMPLAGKMSDIFGRKRIYIVGVGLFTLGSLLSSLAWDIYSLIAFRALQALGGGIIMPTALAAMGSVAPPDKIGKTMGALGSMGALAMIIGPNIGGFVVDHFGWRAAFYINLPIGVLAILLALAFKESYGSEKRHIDLAGSLMLGVGLGSMLLGLNRLGSLPLTDITVFPLFLIALLLGAALYWYEKRTTEPVIDISLITRGDILSLNLGMMAIFYGMICAIGFTATFAQLVLNMGIQDSGSILTPLSVTMFVVSIAGGVLLDRVGFKPMMAAGGVILALGLCGMAFFANDALSLGVALAVVGLGMAASLGGFQVAILTVTPEKERGASMGVNTTFRNISGLIAPVVGGYLLNEGMRGTMTYGQAFRDFFATGAVIAALSLVLTVYIVIKVKKIPVKAAVPMGK